MSKTNKNRLTTKDLLKKGVPAVLIPGLILAGVLGWKNKSFDNIKNYYQFKQIFPKSGVVASVEDGDTFTLKNGVSVRLLGINAPDRGGENYQKSKEKLNQEIADKKVFLEYDRYQDDKYGRVLAWVWEGCEKTPKFTPADYMHKSANESNPGLTDNPQGCKKGKLINEEMVKGGLAQPVSYKDRGELKYEKRLKN
jgi:endonuclease YncB( thermonuclease family)